MPDFEAFEMFFRYVGYACWIAIGALLTAVTLAAAYHEPLGRCVTAIGAN